MLTRFAVLIAACALMTTAVQAQSDATGSTGITATASDAGTGSSAAGQSEGAVTSQIQSSTVDTTRGSGLSDLNASALNTTAGSGASGQQTQTLPGGSQFGRSQQQSSQRGQTGRASSSKTIRPSLRLGFTPVLRPASDVSRAVGRSFRRMATRSARIAETNPALRNVTLVAGTSGLLTLRGSVPTASARRLAENILRMEPGVRTIRNELSVAATRPSR